MVSTFDEPDSEKTKDFWMRCAHEAGRYGSGVGFVSLSGWITAFCYWGEDGKRTPEFTDEMCIRDPYGATLEKRRRLVLDGTTFPLISPKQVPRGVITAPVTVEDYSARVEYKITMIAGLIGVTVNWEGNQVQPRSGWWMLEDGCEVLKDEDVLQEPSRVWLTFIFVVLLGTFVFLLFYFGEGIRNLLIDQHAFDFPPLF